MSAKPPTERYLVTGCAGFIGCSVARQLLAAGHEVVGIDNLSPAYDPRIKNARLAPLRERAGFAFHELDVRDRGAIDRLLADVHRQDARPLTAVFHLAAQAGVRASVENPWLYYETNVTATLHLLEACRQYKVPKFVLASTSSVYGATWSTPFREEAHSSKPLSPYAASKKAAEVLAYSYHALHGLDVSVLRFFTVYGPAGRPDMSVFRFVRQIAEGETLTVFGDGTQQRDFTFVEDVARGTIAAACPLGYEIINLGSDRPWAVNDLIHEISTRLEREPRIEYQPAHAADVPGTWADISKAARLLDWRPETSLPAGLDATIAWYRENRDLAVQINL